ncbi:MAG: hypothetical protein JNL90_20110 [Planctomycetes bacterium]|nr:hypothetical protein [Planctomycetota bacterium]
MARYSKRFAAPDGSHPPVMSDPDPDVFDARAVGGEVCPILPTAIDPDAMSVVRRLNAAGHRAYFVGGCVRDLLLGGTPKDFDIATSARPRQVKKLFRNARIIGRRFRLVHVLFQGNKQIEVSTFRRDPGDSASGGEAPARDFADEGRDDEAELVGDADGGEAERTSGGGAVARSARRGDDDDDSDAEEDLLIREDNVYGTEAEDAVRRDFTINGLFYDVEREQVIDYVGGVPDIRRRTLRTIGEASRRLREDPVRILRAVKFATRLDLALDPLLASAMADHHEELTRSAPPRVFEEILRILGGSKPDRAVEVLVGLGVFRVLFPEMPLHSHHGEADPRLARLLGRLRAMAEIDRGRRSLPTFAYVAVLFWDELLERLLGADSPTESHHAQPSQSLDDFLRPLGTRCRMAKRDTARARAALLALRRIDPRYSDPSGKKRRRRGGSGDFLRREFFHDALLLMEISYRAEGLDPAPLLEWQQKRDELGGGGGERSSHRGGRDAHDARRSPEPMPRAAARPDEPHAHRHSTASAPPAREGAREDAGEASREGGSELLHRRRRRRRQRKSQLFGAPRLDEGEPA